MQVSPEVPAFGLTLIVFNVLVALVRPYRPPTFMGVELWIGGMVTLVVAIVDLLNPLGIGAFERTLLFIAGSINCAAGYYMVLLEARR